MTTMTCSVANCANPLKRRGLCYGHYMKAWRYGTPTPTHAPRYKAALAGRTFSMLTVIRWAEGSWECQCECGAITFARSADLERGSAKSCGNHRMKDRPTYSGAHMRVRSLRGPAAAQVCADCGEQARHWSYGHADPNAFVAPDGRHYSADPAHYDARCVPCHKRFDLNLGP